MVLGYGEGEMFLGSDAIALAPFTRDVTYLEEGDWAILSPEGARLFDTEGNAIDRPIVESTASAARISRGNFPHFMLKEIYEQPGVIGDTLATVLNPAEQTITIKDLSIDLAQVDRITLSACGTAFYAGMVAKYWFEHFARVPVDIDVASEFRYREPVLEEGGLALFISQSGETADTLAALRYCKAQGQTIAAIVNVPTSTMAREADLLLPIHAGPEIGVASTKAFSAQILVLTMIALK